MPQPSEATAEQPSADDSFLELLAETLEAVEEPARGQFLKQFFRTIAQVEVSETRSSELWKTVLRRRRELSESLGRPVSLKSALLEALATSNLLRVPILMEYEEYRKLQINAATDPLTGLHNRRLFDEYCDKELNRARRYAHTLAVVIMDLHKLKEVNDRLGHLRGDQVLQIAASTLEKTLRQSDFSFRIGGDEFALLLPQTDPDQALTLCRRVRAQYESEMKALGIDIGVTLDFGIAVHPQDGDSKPALLRVADERLYRLKYATRAPVEPAAPRAAEAPPAAPPLQEAPPPQQPLPTPSAAAEAPAPSPPPKPVPAAVPSPPPPKQSARPPYTVQRKWERVSLAGTRAHADLGDPAIKTATVIDLSYGGVALLLEGGEDVPSSFNAVLHVPILPPVRVSLKKAYALPAEGGRIRVGCAFVS
ncbi:MAG TPA: GGDEF domain-containing protein [Candidatus Acidoferrum sp.]|nr:GGDEF domain-containing protein [Candidatus Acidoferrum sp.]